MIQEGRPVAGVILAPQRRLAWLADGFAVELSLDENLIPIPDQTRLLKVAPDAPCPKNRIVVSRSHGDAGAAAICAGFSGWEIEKLGSAIKFAAVARGDACLYPRGAGSMEWDTAAGDALIHAAGGSLRAVDGSLKTYGKQGVGFRNGPFVAARDPALLASALSQWPAS
ncbi:MAG: 3'(2'),5'-bisphosphate nucleotidase CysQ family protein, partial [Beijerinckiaceae bacterium]